MSGVAAYGDVRDCLENGSFQASVRDLERQGRERSGYLDDWRLIASQIDQTVRELHGRGMVTSLIFRWETGEAGTAVGRLGNGQPSWMNWP